MSFDKKHYDINNWSYAWGKPLLHGVIRSSPENFQVTEQLTHKPSTDGEHVFLFIEKKNTNTDWVAGLLAKHCGVARRDVSYAGMKDRLAVTRQWFSVYLSNKPEPDWTEINSEDVQVLITTRHQRKLRRGALNGNQFEIKITNLEGATEGLTQLLTKIRDMGVPNYFGEQRFGKHGNNIQRALEMFSGRRVKRQQRSIYLSAARSYLFNEVLSQRIQKDTWRQVAEGDVLMLSGTRSVFVAETKPCKSSGS